MTLKEAQELAIAKMEEHGLTIIRTVQLGTSTHRYYDGWVFEFCNSKRVFGYCVSSKKTIQLSRHLTTICSDEEVLDTILHEIAHAICPPVLVKKNKSYRWDIHSAAWRKFFISIGGNGERCGVITPEMKQQTTYKYTVSCNSCGKSYGKHRMSEKRLTSPRSCGICCPNKYNENFKLTITQNY